MKYCPVCGDTVPDARLALGYRLCLPCGEAAARQRRHTIAPLPKSNYVVITDHSLLVGLNSSHKGGR
jgi:hypothetical protein